MVDNFLCGGGHGLKHAIICILVQVQLVLAGLLVLCLRQARRQLVSVIPLQVKREDLLLGVELMPAQSETQRLVDVVSVSHVVFEVIARVKFPLCKFEAVLDVCKFVSIVQLVKDLSEDCIALCCLRFFVLLHQTYNEALVESAVEQGQICLHL